MHVVQLKINGYEDRVRNNFHFAAKLAGDALVYWAYSDAKNASKPMTVLVPDQGDNELPKIGQWNMEILDPTICGFNSQGRLVTVFRSGNRISGTNDWDGTASFFMGVGAPSERREPGQSIVVQTTQPGPKGDKGDKGDPGVNAVVDIEFIVRTVLARLPQGAIGMLTNEDVQRVAKAAAEQVFNMAPAPDHFGLPEHMHYGTRFQEMFAVMINQALVQHVAVAADEGMANLLGPNSTFKSKSIALIMKLVGTNLPTR